MIKEAKGNMYEFRDTYMEPYQGKVFFMVVPIAT